MAGCQRAGPRRDGGSAPPVCTVRRLRLAQSLLAQSLLAQSLLAQSLLAQSLLGRPEKPWQFGSSLVGAVRWVRVAPPSRCAPGHSKLFSW